MRLMPRLVGLVVGATALICIPAPGFSQDTNESSSEPLEEIIVTGSRIKRDTYTSVSPLQIISAEVARQAGLTDPATILQESIAAAGIQIDTTFQEHVLDNGPGASNIALRGLGIDRTLVLVDGRRLAPSGVEGAPTAPDLNMVPAGLVRQYDILLDGASSIYGSDAVAGVVNILLRKDFDGLEIETFARSPEQSGGLENSLSLAWGRNFSSGLFGIGAEYVNKEPVTLGQRRWSAECRRPMEIDENGDIRTTNIRETAYRGQRPSDCAFGLFGGSMYIPDLRSYVGGIDEGPGAVYYTPGYTNIGIPNFSESHYPALPGGFDGDGDGEQDVHYWDYMLNQYGGGQHLFPDFERISALAYGEYTFAGDSSLTPFLELHYNQRDMLARAGEEGPLMLGVPADNPYNVCNPNGLDGVDCALAWNDFWAHPSIIERVMAEYGAPPQDFGLGFNPPVGGMRTVPRVRVVGDRDLVNTSVTQTRVVAGLRGDLPNLDWGSLEDWSFELAAVASWSDGTSSRPGIREDWLLASLETSVVDPNTGEVVCGIDTTGDGIPDGVNADGRSCVPVNLWAPSLYEGIVGDFATQAERDYVFDSRDFDTEYDQWFVTGLVMGDLFRMPAGPVAAVFGFEYRQDEINSIPDEVARDGLFFMFIEDAGAVGRKYTRELFAETEFPLLRGVTGARELALNLSGRYTEDQYFGSDTTYSAKLGWRPFDSLLLRGTTGTSFRAPNVRERFIVAQTSPGWVSDPCPIPPEAWDPINGEYNPDLDPRPPYVLQNCMNNGADPTQLNFWGWNDYEVVTETGGTKDLVPETSECYSYGFVWDQPVFETFDFTVGWTYYKVEVNNSIIEPTPQQIVNDCYGRAKINSVLCHRITRSTANGGIAHVSSEFLNRDELLVSGHDINLTYIQSLTMFNRPVDLTIDVVLNHPEEASQTFTDGTDYVDYEDRAGEWGFPDWRGIATLRADIGNFSFSWSTRYIGSVDQDPAEIDPWGDVYKSTGYAADTCLGPSQGDVLCRDVGFADDYLMHTASLYYYSDMWTVGGGVRNVFDEPPPLVDGSGSIQTARNMPLGYGYDLNGRTFFLNVAAKFE